MDVTDLNSMPRRLYLYADVAGETFALSAEDQVIDTNCYAGPVTIELPAAADAIGRIYAIRTYGAATLFIKDDAAVGANIFYGATKSSDISVTGGDGSYMVLYCDGTSFFALKWSIV